MTKAVVMRQTGGPEVLRLRDIEAGAPGPAELRVQQTAIGVNFHDVYVRTGLYRTLHLPSIPGIEAVGVVTAVGPDTTGFRAGRPYRVHYGIIRRVRRERVLPAAIALRVPESLGDIAAASVTLKGMTACMLLRHVHQVQPGQEILVHAAAGGVGQLLCRWPST